MELNIALEHQLLQHVKLEYAHKILQQQMIQDVMLSWVDVLLNLTVVVSQNQEELVVDNKEQQQLVKHSQEE